MKYPIPSSKNLLKALLLTSSLTAITAVTIASKPTSASAQIIAQVAAPAVTDRSSTEAIALAKHLKKIGAKLYTAYWCPHCHTQRQRFGVEAEQHLTVIECDRRGVNQQNKLCVDKKITAFPTWEINGTFYKGTKTLQNLAKISNYSARD